MKKLMSNNYPIFTLIAIASLAFLFSAYQSQSNEYNPCDPVGSYSWDGYNCHCRPGFTGLCCEVPQEPDPWYTPRGCSINPLAHWKHEFIKCQITIKGDAELKSKLVKFVHVDNSGNGEITVSFENFAYECIRGRMLERCDMKDCATALSQIIAAIK